MNSNLGVFTHFLYAKNAEQMVKMAVGKQNIFNLILNRLYFRFHSRRKKRGVDYGNLAAFFVG